MIRARPIPVVATVTAMALGPFLAACGSAGPSAAAETSGRLVLRNVRVDRPALPGRAAVRLVIVNGTDRDDTLESVSSPDATRADVHRSTTDAQGRSVMGATGALKVPAHSRVTFAPGGLHVMLTGVERDLAVGDTVTLSFTFARAGAHDVDAEVVEPGTGGSPEASRNMDEMEGKHADG